VFNRSLLLETRGVFYGQRSLSRLLLSCGSRFRKIRFAADTSVRVFQTSVISAIWELCSGWRMRVMSDWKFEALWVFYRVLLGT